MDGITRSADEHPIRFDLLTENPVYKPFRYPWAYEAWLTQQRVHWLPEEVPLADDVKDWHRNLTDGERNLLTQIFRFFTQADVEVNNCYMKHYSQVFKPTEVLMMLSAFSNIETVHIAAYSHLLDTIGMPEIEYTAFLKYKEMKDKYDYMHGFSVENAVRDRQDARRVRRLHRRPAVVRLLRDPAEFPTLRQNEGHGPDRHLVGARRKPALPVDHQAVPHLHQENPDLWTEDLRREIYLTCATIVSHEDAFIDLAFEQGAVEGLTPREVKQYIRFIADRRLIELGLSELFHVAKNPLPWLDEMLNAVEHANFFENRATEYSKASTAGTWEEAFGDPPIPRAPVPDLAVPRRMIGRLDTGKSARSPVKCQNTWLLYHGPHLFFAKVVFLTNYPLELTYFSRI